MNIEMERQAFEQWADRQWPGAQRKQLERDDYGRYKNSIYQDYWTGWEARATRPAQTEQQPVAVPQCVRDWYDAKASHVAAVDAYNARLTFIREHEPFGTSVNPEYQIMEAAERKARALLGPMFTGLSELFAAPIAQTALSAVTAERDSLLQFKAAHLEWHEKTEWVQETAQVHELGKHRADVLKDRIDQLRAEVEMMREDAERWRYVSLQGDDTHWLNLLRVDLEDFGGNINAAVDALIDGDTPVTAAKEA